ncbi:hypothetical protein WAI453_004372 [Rhynchosporium graminicola]
MEDFVGAVEGFGVKKRGKEAEVETVGLPKAMFDFPKKIIGIPHPGFLLRLLSYVFVRHRTEVQRCKDCWQERHLPGASNNAGESFLKLVCKDKQS